MALGCNARFGPEPAATPPETDRCEAFQGYTGALAMATIDCLGSISPTNFRVEGGVLRRNFDRCTTPPVEPEPKPQPTDRDRRLLHIDRVLSVQLPARRETLLKLVRADVANCIATVYAREAERFAQAGNRTCPNWTLKQIVGLPTKTNVEAVVGSLPPVVKGNNGPMVAPLPLGARVRAAESFEFYTVAFPAGTPRQPCGAAEECAVACARVFPGFVAATYGEIVVGDGYWWMNTTDFGFTDSSPLSRANGYRHEMATARTPAIYGVYERAMPNSAPEGSMPEQCTFWNGATTPQMGHLGPDLGTGDPATFMSRCMLPP